MCDEEKIARWAREGLSRREFGVLGAAAAITACSPALGAADTGTQAVTSPGFPSFTETAVSFATPDGTMDGWLAAPTSGPAPAVILWPDIAGVRDSKKAMARRLADRGFTTLVANQYYRDTPAPIWASFADFAANGGWDRARAMRGKLDAQAIMRDAAAAVAFLDGRPEVDTGRGIGTQGYCMGGPFAMWTAAAVPARVKAAASFHGGGLLRPDAPMSPHKLFGQMQADLLIAIAQDDDAEAPGEKDALREAAQAVGRPAAIEVFAGDHGWCVPDSPAYAEAEAERAWSELLKLYGMAL
ncbi:MAG: dienelactone hydrolase family protein [Erythrobacter sp.]